MGKLEHGYTCYQIDRFIQTLKEDLRDTVDFFLNDLKEFPYLIDDEIAIESFVQRLYEQSENCIEEVRITNSDIRETADSQISMLEEQVQNLYMDVDNLTNEIDNLNYELRRAQNV